MRTHGSYDADNAVVDRALETTVVRVSWSFPGAYEPLPQNADYRGDDLWHTMLAGPRLTEQGVSLIGIGAITGSSGIELQLLRLPLGLSL